MQETPNQSKKPRALLIAEACDPDGASVPLVGWSHANALRELVDAHLLTHPRTRDAIVARGLVEGRDFTLIDNEHVARPLFRLANALRGGDGKGRSTAACAGRRATGTAGALRRSGSATCAALTASCLATGARAATRLRS